MNKGIGTDVQRTDDYRSFVTELKKRVTEARISAARAVNRELILLYWDIGRAIVEKQKTHGWGESVVEMVSKDLQAEFPALTGFSPRNLWDMKRFHETYAHGPAILRQLVAELPWGHNILIFQRIETEEARKFYLEAAIEMGWSRNVLLNQIKAGAYERTVIDKKQHNFGLVLSDHLAEQADEMLKSSYNLEFLGINRAVKEQQLEERLTVRLKDFLLELGYGFCFVGRQHRLKLGRKEYFIDLLFYHRFLKALVAFELKVGAFEPEYAGKMDFYLNLLNDTERATDDNPSIGIILCAEKDDVEVEYSLRTKSNPIGVAAYQLQSRLPGSLKGKLPTVKQLADVVRAEMEAAE